MTLNTVFRRCGSNWKGAPLSLKFGVARNFLSPPPRNVAGWLSWLMSGKPIAFWNPVPERAAIRDAVPRAKCDAVELHAGLARHLQAHFPEVRIWCGDFLEYHPERRYTRIIMNPPFNRGDDIRHIRRALTLLEPGGILTGICLDGPRQQKALESLADVWEPLPRGTFTYTQVATAILRITV